MRSLLAISLVIFVVAAPTHGLDNPRKLQESSVPVDPNSAIRCGGCPSCNTPCTQSPPSPPPPPSPKKPSKPSSNCPPPPSYIYMTGPPGNLYPVDPNYSGASSSLLAGLPLLVGCGFLMSFLALSSMAL